MNQGGAIKGGVLLSLLLMSLALGFGLGAPIAGGQERLETEGILESLERLDRAVVQQQSALESALAQLQGLEAQRVQLLQEQSTLLAAMEDRRRVLGKRIRALYKYSGRGFMQAVLGGAESSQGGSSGASQGAFKRTRYLYYVVRHDMALLEVQKEDLARSKGLSQALEDKEVALKEAATLAESETLALEDERRRRLALLDAVRRESALQDRVRRERAAANARLGEAVASLPQRQRATAKPKPPQQAMVQAPAPTSQPPTPQPVAALQPNPAPTPTLKTIPTPLPKAEAPPSPAPLKVQPPSTPEPLAQAPTLKPAPPTASPTAPPKPSTPKPSTAKAITPKPSAPTPQAVAQLPPNVAPPAPTPLPQAQSPFEARRGRHIYPTTGKITRTYGRYKVEGMMAPAFSKGLEIVAPTGTPFKAVASGQVQMADWFKGYGLMVIINHGDDYRSIYTHASRLLVKVGDQVDAGDVIGLVGETGSLKGPYLYVELRQGKTPLNPMMWLKIPPGSIDLK